MKITEVNQDLFTVPKNYILVHCVSADFAMGAGIAKEFAKRGVKEWLNNSHFKIEIGMCIVTTETGWRAEFNLITKDKYWQKPTYGTLRKSLEDAKKICIRASRDLSLAMPKIGCGLDKLKWDKVKQIIEDVFADTDIEILVCSI